MAKRRHDEIDPDQLTRYLGPLELRIIQDVWENGPSTVNDVLARLNRSAVSKLVYNTVMSTLARLAEKGFLDRRRDGRAYVYFGEGPVEFLQSRAAEVTRELVEGLGQVGVAGIIDGLAASPESTGLLRRLLEDGD